MKTNRIIWIDALRGLAVMLMILYHFSFDLNYFGFIRQSFNDSAFWLSARAFIVSLFLLVAGMSLVLAAGKSRKSFLLRIGKIAAAALAVSLGSYLMFPKSWIFFGILHSIVLASLIGAFMLRFYWSNLLAGITIVLVGSFYSHPFFDQAPLQWIGLMTFKPITEDYVPLFPWLGVLLCGIFLGKRLLAMNSFDGVAAQWGRIPAWLGRRSLAIYLLHQPILIGLLSLL